MASVDLLPQLRETAGLSPDHVAVDLPGEAGGGEEESGRELHAFYDIIMKVNKEITSMKTMTEELNSVHNQLHCATSDSSKKELRQQASDLQDRIGAESRSVKENLDNMQKVTERCKHNEQEHPAELRIQENQYMLLRQEFVAALTAFQDVEQQNKDKYKDTIVRRIKTKFSHQQLSDDQVDKLAKDVLEKGVDVFSSGSNNLMIATTTLEEVVEMRNDIHKIEVSLKQLHQMFLDMAVLVAEQGELINDIRDNVGKASNYVFEGTKHVRKAKEYQTKSRRRMCMIILCVVIIVAVVIVVVVVMKS